MTAVSTATPILATPRPANSLPKLLTAPGVAIVVNTTGADDKGEVAFGLWKATFHAINTSPMEDGENGADAVRWDAIDRLESDILLDQAATARAAERKLWVALAHDPSLTDAADNHAATSEGIAHLLGLGDALDWNTRFHVEAIVTLRRAQGRA